MKLTLPLLTLAAAAVGASVVAASEKLPDKLQVGVKYRPEVCDDKSQAGDLLAMHYTGTLVSFPCLFDPPHLCYVQK